jgi:hypothetical protein
MIMRDLLFAVIFLLTSTFLGLPLAAFLPTNRFRIRVFSAPAAGIGALSVISALGFRAGLAPWQYAAIEISLAGVFLLWNILAHKNILRRPNQGPHPYLGILVGITVLLLSLAPKWVGGAQFAAFQGNHYDQINYLSYAATARKFSYQELDAFDSEKKKGANFYSLVSENLDDRFAVSQIYAGFTDFFGFDTVETSYAFMAALQTVFFFSVSFLLLQLGRSHWRVWLCAAAATLGFPLQYVIDVSAWSELASLPVVTLALILLLDQYDPAYYSTAATVQRVKLGASAGALFGSLFYLYPEITPIYAIGLMAAVAYAGLSAKPKASARIAASSAIQAIAALSICLPYLHGTLRWLTAQMSSAIRARPDWWTYFQRYLYEAASSLLASMPVASASKLFLVSVGIPTDFLLAAIGLYFVLPDGSSKAAIPWILLNVVFLLWILFACVTALGGLWHKAEIARGRLLIVAVIGMLAAVSLLGLSSRYWVGGKGLSMIQPMLFIVLCAPLWLGCRRMTLVLPSLVLISLYLGFGFYRPYAASGQNGIHYAPPYPGVLDSSTKSKYRWDFFSYKKQMMRDCKGILLDVDNLVLERYAQVFLIGLGVPWYTKHEIDPNWGEGQKLGLQRPIDNVNCVLSSDPRSSYPGISIFPLWSDQVKPASIAK